jgi:predicted nucleic acid-binding protein
MRLVDTSAWIEWLIGSPTGAAVAPAIPAPEDWLVPTVVQVELAKWLTREAGEDKADQVLAFTQTCQTAPLDTRIALLAADVCRQHKLATAVDRGADLLTCDAHFRGLGGVVFIPKVGTCLPSFSRQEREGGLDLNHSGGATILARGLAISAALCRRLAPRSSRPSGGQTRASDSPGPRNVSELGGDCLLDPRRPTPNAWIVSRARCLANAHHGSASTRVAMLRRSKPSMSVDSTASLKRLTELR